MKPTIELINALRQAADILAGPNLIRGYELEGDGYSHAHSDQCNCGWLARCLGIDRDRVKGLEHYTSMAATYFFHKEQQESCQVTGLYFVQVIDYLANRGMEKGDFKDVEYLQNDAVLARAGLEKPQIGSRYTYNDPVCVARYFLAQADILEEQLGEQFETRPLALMVVKQPVEAR